jgi:hypothetical protein
MEARSYDVHIILENRASITLYRVWTPSSIFNLLHTVGEGRFISWPLASGKLGNSVRRPFGLEEDSCPRP